MKIEMSKLYRKQVMKPMVTKILSLQLLIEREFLPRIDDEVAWNADFHRFALEDHVRAK